MTDWDKFWSTRKVHFPDEDLVRFLSTLPPGQECLDVGCGTGRNGQAFQAFGHKAVTFDSAPSAVRRAAMLHTYERLWDGRADDIPCTDGSFDVVTDVCTLQHVPDVRACAMEVSRVLRPGGLLFSKFTSRAIDKVNAYEDLNPTHFVYLEELQEWFEPLRAQTVFHHRIEDSDGWTVNAHWVTTWKR